MYQEVRLGDLQLGDFRLGDWVVRPRLNRIERPTGLAADAGGGDPSDARRHLEPRAMELLLYLAARPRQVVARDEILAAVWDGRYVAAQALNHTVWELRRALGDRARDPRYIETVTKRGYRLLAPVRRLEPASEPSRRSPAAVPTIGVAPWRDFSPGPSTGTDREAFCAAMTELLTTLLAQLDALEVVLLGSEGRRASSTGGGAAAQPPADGPAADGSTADGERPAREHADDADPGRPRDDLEAATAGLDAVIEGSALLSADRVRMTARLVAAGGKHLWAGAYDRELNDVLRLQSEVVQQIVGEIERRLRER